MSEDTLLAEICYVHPQTYVHVQTYVQLNSTAFRDMLCPSNLQHAEICCVHLQRDMLRVSTASLSLELLDSNTSRTLPQDCCSRACGLVCKFCHLVARIHLQLWLPMLPPVSIVSRQGILKTRKNNRAWRLAREREQLCNIK